MNERDIYIPIEDKNPVEELLDAVTLGMIVHGIRVLGNPDYYGMNDFNARCIQEALQHGFIPSETTVEKLQ